MPHCRAPIFNHSFFILFCLYCSRVIFLGKNQLKWASSVNESYQRMIGHLEWDRQRADVPQGHDAHPSCFWPSDHLRLQGDQFNFTTYLIKVKIKSIASAFRIYQQLPSILEEYFK